MEPRRWKARLAAIGAGYVAALLLAAGIVFLVGSSDPSAMAGFGNFLMFLMLAGGLALVPSVFLFRLLRESDRAFGAVSWLALGWSSLALPAGAVRLLGTSFRHASPIVFPPLVDVASLLRVFASPASLAVLVAGWLLSPVGGAGRRRFGRSALLEAVGTVMFAAWFGMMVVSSF